MTTKQWVKGLILPYENSAQLKVEKTITSRLEEEVDSFVMMGYKKSELGIFKSPENRFEVVPLSMFKEKFNEDSRGY